jgi:hypothetical protein
MAGNFSPRQLIVIIINADLLQKKDKKQQESMVLNLKRNNCVKLKEPRR